MKNSRGVSLIALIITIIVIIILAAIVMQASSDTINNAQYAGFAQEFGEYTDSFKIDAANVKSTTGIRGQQINTAQQYYMAANGMTNIAPTSGDTPNTKQGVAGYAMPVGYVLTNMNTQDPNSAKWVLQKILNIGSGDGWTMTPQADTATGADANVHSTGNDESCEVAYVIRDAKTSYAASTQEKVTDGSADKEFYGDSNGKEYHFVTSNGQVFTLPGYPVPQSDGTIEYHIDTQNGHYYVVAGNSGKTPAKTNLNVNGDAVTNLQPIQASYLEKTHGVNAFTGGSINALNNHGNIAEQARKTNANGAEAE